LGGEAIDGGREAMTPKELQKLRDWAAGVMGFKIYKGPIFEKDITIFPCVISYKGRLVYMESGTHGERVWWCPDDPTTGQIWMIVERMRELGFNWWDIQTYQDKWYVRIIKDGIEGMYYNGEGSLNTNPCIAILLVAKATEDELLITSPPPV
jgi:hypothetical protein